MDKLSDHMFVFKGDGLIKDFYGNYSEFRELQKEEEKQLKSVEKKKNISNEKTEKKSFLQKKVRIRRTRKRNRAWLENEKEELKNLY